MEEACHQLDLTFAESTGSLNQGGVSFENYSSAIKKLFLCKEEAQKQTQVVSLLEQLSTFSALTLPEENPALERLRSETLTQKQKLKDMVKLTDS